MCHLCGKGFPNNIRLQSHVDTNHSEPAHCEFCFTTFTSKISLYKHHITLHKAYPLTMDTTKLDFCEECSMPCLNKLAVKKHLYMHKHKYIKNQRKKKPQQEGK